VAHTDHKYSGVRVLIFDLDGTLIDSKLDLALSVNAMLAHMGRQELVHDDIFALVGNGAPVLVRRALGPNTTDKEADVGLSYFLSYYREHMLDHTVLYPGVREALDQLDAGRSLAVLTNKPVRFSQAIVDGLGIGGHFKYVYGGNSFEQKKPDPIGVSTLLGHFAATASEAMMIGDSEVDTQTARNSGIWACGVTYGLGSERLPASAPDLLLDSLLELPLILDGGTAGK
jgi:phosphoglycolate phosphatase